MTQGWRNELGKKGNWRKLPQEGGFTALLVRSGMRLTEDGRKGVIIKGMV